MSMQTNLDLNIDLDEAKRFLFLLDSDADAFTFQAFDDNKDRKDPKLARVRHGSLEKLAYELVWLNNAGLDGHSTFGHEILLRSHIIKLKPDMIIFLTGINDFLKYFIYCTPQKQINQTFLIFKAKKY